MCKIGLVVPLSFLIALTCVSCSSLNSISGKSPSSAVKGLYMACNAGDYSKVDGFFVADVKELFHSQTGTLASGVKEICDAWTHGGTITGIDIKSETVRGEGATVVIDVHFKDNSTRRGDVTELVKENGEWKIAKNRRTEDPRS